MKQYLFFPLIILSFNIFGQITFERYYGGVGYDGSYCVQQKADEGYIICGLTSYDENPLNSDFYIINTDEYGDTIWCRIYPGHSVDGLNCIKLSSEGGYVVTGSTSSFGSGNYDAVLMKIDDDGNIIWCKTYGGSGPDYSTWCLEVGDGYVLAGITQSYGAGDADIYLVRTDMAGDTLWTRTYGGTGFDQSSEIQKTSDGGYIITGETENVSNGDLDVLLLKVDSNGLLEWQKIYGSNLYDSGRSVQQTNDSGYIIAGHSGSLTTGDDGFIIKTDSEGDTIWTRKFGGPAIERLYSVAQTTDDGYIFAGQTTSYGAGSYDVLLLKSDSIGNTQWFETYGGASGDGAFCVQLTNDGGFILTGITASMGYGSYDAYLIKVDDSGNILTNCPENEYSSNLKLYPNPTSDYINITCNEHIELNIEIFSLTGDLIYQNGFKQNQSKIDCRCYAPGMYLIKTTYNNIIETNKVIIK